MFYIIYALYCAYKDIPMWHRSYTINGITIKVYSTLEDHYRYFKTASNTIGFALDRGSIDGCYGMSCSRCPANCHNHPPKYLHPYAIEDRSSCRNTILTKLSRPIYKGRS